MCARLGGLQPSGGIANRTAHASVDVEVGDGPQRFVADVAAARRFQADQAARRRAVTDRSETVAGVRHRYDARRHRRRSAARRAAGRVVEAPWIARCPDQRRFSHHVESEFRHRRAANRDQPGIGDRARIRCIVGGDEVAERGGAPTRRDAPFHDHVLDHGRDTGQRAGARRRGLRAGAVEIRPGDKIELRIDGLGAFNRALDQRGGRRAARVDRFAQAGGVGGSGVDAGLVCHASAPGNWDRTVRTVAA